MQISGVKTYNESVRVTVEPKDVFAELRKAVAQKYDISLYWFTDGNRNVFEWVDMGHDSVKVAIPQATPEQITIMETLEAMYDLVRVLP